MGLRSWPSSNVIYGIVIMFSLQREVTPGTAPGLFGVGRHRHARRDRTLDFSNAPGEVCASAIHASKTKPEIFGLSVAPAAIVEGFTVFAFVFALVLAGGIPSIEVIG